MKKSLIAIAIAAAVSAPAMALDLSAVGGSAVASSASASLVGNGSSNQLSGAAAGNTTSISGMEGGGVATVSTQSDGYARGYSTGAVSGNGVGSADAFGLQGGLAEGTASSGGIIFDSHSTNLDHTTAIGFGNASVDSTAGQGSGFLTTSSGTGYAAQSTIAGAQNTSTASIAGQANADHLNASVAGQASTSVIGSSYVSGAGAQTGNGFGISGALSGQTGEADATGVGFVNLHDHGGLADFSGNGVAVVDSHSEGSSVTGGIGVNEYTGTATQSTLATNDSTVLIDVSASPTSGTVITDGTSVDQAAVSGVEFGTGSVIGGGFSNADANGGAISFGNTSN